MLKLVGVLGLSSLAFAGGSYTVAVISIPSGFTNVQMVGINNAGQVAGNGSNQIFIGRPGSSSIIPLTNGVTNPTIFAINASGQVAGKSTGLGIAFIGSTTGTTVVPPPDTWSVGTCCGINDAGQLAGRAVNGGTLFNDKAFIGTPAGSTIIPLPTGATQATGYFPAVNNFGQVMASSNAGGTEHAFIGTPAGSVSIPLPSGFTGATGISINDSGQVAGFGVLGANNRAFIGTTAGSSAIPLPVGATNVFLDSGSLNNSGVVVGTSDMGGWIWDSNNGTLLFNGMVPAGWNVTNAISISNNGLILAQAALNGGATQFVELLPGATPVLPGTPAPSTFILVMIGVAGCLAWLRFRGIRTA